MKSFRTIAEGSFFVTATFLVTLAVVVVTIHAWGWNSGNVASWVQAVGSIAAIVGSYFIGERQAKASLAATQKAHQLAEETRQAVEALEERERRQGMYAVILAAHTHTVQIKEALSDEFNIKMYSIYHPSIIDSMIELLSRLPIHTLGSERAISAFVIYSGQFTFLKGAMAEYLAGPYTDEINKKIAELKKYAYDEKYSDDLISTKRAVLRKNVETHIDRIQLEFQVLDQEISLLNRRNFLGTHQQQA
ncbi:hypothetical protein [Burkholderia diffusa]|uniref:hypothetical protein n=1 Tax=Burkholderia diffusa TaxID=488732 RepID=UPI000841FBFF|nr:hypothetical protein [Burkholderia diffusa]AOI60420.1 hypothetical protein WI26_22885 [Burkholderia diffusa]